MVPLHYNTKVIHFNLEVYSAKIMLFNISKCLLLHFPGPLGLTYPGLSAVALRSSQKTSDFVSQ